MLAMGMVEMPRDQVIGVIAVRNCFVAAARAMDVSRLVVAAVMSWSAGIGILFTYRNRMLYHRSPFVLVTQVPVMQVIDVPVVFDLDMPTIGTVLVIVLGSGHGFPSPVRGQCSS